MRSLEVCWKIEANCCGAAGAAEGWSLLHWAAAAADVVESSLSHHHLLLLEFAGTDDEGQAGEASLLAAAALLDQDPFPAARLEALTESGFEELGAAFHQMLGY